MTEHPTERVAKHGTERVAEHAAKHAAKRVPECGELALATRELAAPFTVTAAVTVINISDRWLRDGHSHCNGPPPGM